MKTDSCILLAVKNPKKTSLTDVIPLASWPRYDSINSSHEERQQTLDRRCLRGSFEKKDKTTDEPDIFNPNSSKYSGNKCFRVRSMTMPGRLSSRQKEKLRKKLNLFEKTKKLLLDKTQRNDKSFKIEKEEENSLKGGLKTLKKIDLQSYEIDKKAGVSFKEIPSSASFCSSQSICFDLGTKEVKPFFKRKCSRLRVLFDFEACAEDDVTVERGELVVVYNKEDKEWFWVETSDGRQGFVPKSYLWPCGCYGMYILTF